MGQGVVVPNRDHQRDHLRTEAGFEGQSTYKKDYVEKEPGWKGRGVPSIDPWGSNLPREEGDVEGWAKGMTTTSREAFVGMPPVDRAAKDPKLQESHFSLAGPGAVDYGTTSQHMLVAHPPADRGLPAMTKTTLQKSSVRLGDSTGPTDVTTSQAAFAARPMERAVKSDLDHTRSSVVLGRGAELRGPSTHAADYTEKTGEAFERARPIIDPHASSIPAGPVSPGEWARSVARHGDISAADRAGARRAPFNPNLLGSNLPLGEGPTDYATTSKDTFVAQDMKPGDRALAFKPDLQRSSITEAGGRPDHTTTSGEAFQARPGEAYRAVSQREVHRTSNVVLGKDRAAGQWQSSYHADYTEKWADNKLGAPNVDPAKVHVSNGPLSRDEWAKELTTTKRDAYKAFPPTREAGKDPKLQQTHIHFGNDGQHWASTSSTQFEHHCEACCDCVAKQGKIHA